MAIQETKSHEIQWSYNELLRRVLSYVDGENILLEAPRLFIALSENKDEETGMSKDEWVWLQYNLGFIKKIVENKLASAMFYHLLKSSFHSFSPREMAAKTGSPESTVTWWGRYFMEKNLFLKRGLNYDRRIYYVLNKKPHVIIRLIKDVILTSYLPKELEEFLTKTKEKTRKIENNKKRNRKGMKKLRAKRLAHKSYTDDVRVTT